MAMAWPAVGWMPRRSKAAQTISPVRPLPAKQWMHTTRLRDGASHSSTERARASTELSFGTP